MQSAQCPEQLAYTVEDAARVSTIGRTHIYALINQGRLKATKVGKRTLIPADSLKALVAGEV
ncbi:helix-turn-helix domain-containing protein [Novosphingobium olei]|uniref:Helix-turn-helix domain-containing protein n=1 Tax=Novosphingobium olei TaxID=2728851 RepID=A0A7Y0BQS2_9SPHN|nr:helix-turn-helix domain-containing protein [Novosphingobium olei]NML94728.1 helix-turn-helix domain-containing protein [Novosphingobium olei]